MDISGGPAALGGIMMCVALAAWALGRWQSAFSTLDDTAALVVGPSVVRQGDPRCASAEPAEAASFQRATTAKHDSAIASADSLIDLHAEICAYRRTEQILATVDFNVLAPGNGQTVGRNDGSSFGMIRKPAGHVHALACTCGCCGDQPLSVLMPQPSLAVAAATRV